jgi:hypothetical protein
MVRVNMIPDIVPIQGRRVAYMDHFYETYLYSNGALKLVGWEDPGPNPGLIPF